MKNSTIRSFFGRTYNFGSSLRAFTMFFGILVFVSCQNEQAVQYDNDNKISQENIKNIKPDIKKPEQDKPVQGKTSLKETGAVKRNVFLSRDEEKYYAVEDREEIAYLNLSAVFYSSKAAYAVVNGQVIKKRDILDNKEVVDIAKEEITLKDTQGKEYIVKMKKIME